MKRCAACGEMFARPPGMWQSKWRDRRTCGKTECRMALTKLAGALGAARNAALEHEGTPIDAPMPRQIHYARHSATKAELRLMSPAILAAAGVRL